MAYGIAERHMPRFKHLDLSHDPVGKARRRRQVRQSLQAAHHTGQVGQSPSAFWASLQVSPEGGYAKSLLIVEELIDFFGE